MKYFYYYKRDRKNRPVKTSCLAVHENGDYARGVSVCCDLDSPCKRVGRKIAKQRADKVLEKGWGLETDKGFLMGEYFPTLTDQEKKFLKPKKIRDSSSMDDVVFDYSTELAHCGEQVQ